MIREIPKVTAPATASSEELLKLYRIKESDLEIIRSTGDYVLPKIQLAIDEFYGWMSQHPSLMAFFDSEKTLRHVQKMQGIYWETFMRANITNEYVIDRRRIGEIHARIGLPVIYYMGAVSMVYDQLTEISQSLFDNTDVHNSGEYTHQSLNESMSGLLHLDAGLICQSFVDKRDQMLNEQSQAVAAMSTPVTEIWDGILLLPIVGIVDSRRSEEIMSTVLESISRTKAKEFILDISGVGLMDTAVINYLISVIKAAGLMGCSATISGISPTVSKTIIQLGVDTASIRSTGTMMDALKIAFKSQGVLFERGS